MRNLSKWPHLALLNEIVTPSVINLIQKSHRRWVHLKIHTPPVVHFSKIFHRGCIDFKCNSPLCVGTSSWCTSLKVVFFMICSNVIAGLSFVNAPGACNFFKKGHLLQVKFGVKILDILVWSNAWYVQMQVPYCF